MSICGTDPLALSEFHKDESGTCPLSFPTFEFALEQFDRETHDVGKGAFDAFDEEFAMFLDGIGPRLIQGIDQFQVALDLDTRQWQEVNIRAVRKRVLPVDPEVDETNPGDDLMGFVLECLEHLNGFTVRRGFAKPPVADTNKRVRTEDKRVRMLLGDHAGLPVGIELTDFVGGELGVLDFRRFTRDDLE